MARYYHSSCELSGYIYVFCGKRENCKLNSVEKLFNDVNYPNQQFTKKWEKISSSSLLDLPKLSNHFTVSLNKEEILIFGGHGQTEPEVQIYDTITDSCSSVAVTSSSIKPLEIYNYIHDGDNSIAKFAHNKTVALVHSESDGKPNLITYFKETSSIAILDFPKLTQKL